MCESRRTERNEYARRTEQTPNKNQKGLQQEPNNTSARTESACNKNQIRPHQEPKVVETGSEQGPQKDEKDLQQEPNKVPRRAQQQTKKAGWLEAPEARPGGFDWSSTAARIRSSEGQFRSPQGIEIWIPSEPHRIVQEAPT